jgi:predicted nucleic acid-binding protein
VENILATMHYISLSKEIENTTIDLRRQHNFKTPDALIAATAKALSLELLTLDQTLAKRMGEILDDDQSATNSESDRA